MVGKSLAHYEILERVGAGGMGEVYRARDTKLGRDVALKVLPPELAADKDRRRRFMQEARAVAALNHPNIVTIFSVEEVDDLHFLTMELVKGAPLHKHIREQGLSPEEILEIAIPLADALSAAHELGVVHRDLKPSNLMLGEDGRVKVLDFGLATFVHSSAASTESPDEQTRTQLSATGVIVGTMPYMSPEQVEGKQVDPRSDIFSLGIILHELATGSRPFAGDTAPALMSSILKDAPPLVSDVSPEQPEAFARIVARCLEKDPKRRVQTARDVHNELRDLRDGLISGSAIFRRSATSGVPATGEHILGAAGFSHDIYISYAHLDNEVQLAGQDGWVSGFHRSLEVRVGQLLGKKPSIWRDPKVRGDDALEESNIEQIPSSALLITVLSPRYIKSEWCTRELQEFMSASGRTGGPKWGTKYRVFKVVKTPTPVEKHPPEIQPLLGYEFFKVDPDTGRTRELDQMFGPDAQREYWSRLDDLAHDVVALLENAESALPASDAPSGPTAESSHPAASVPGKGSIYLAQTTYDLKEEHDAVRRDLQRHRYAILPEQPLPLLENELRSYVADQLGGCMMSIHLVGRNYGVVPEGATNSVAALQNELAVDRASAGDFKRVVWLPSGLDVADDRQREFVQLLRTDPRMHHGSDLLETPIEDLKTVVHSLLEPPARPEVRVKASTDTDITHVYLICDQRDQDNTSPLADFLFDKGLEVTLPVFEGDEAEVREDHEDNLRLCDAVLLYYGAANELWLRRKLREVRKSPGLGRTKAMRAKGIWIAPPVTPQKSRLRIREALIMSAPESFAAEPLQPFLKALGEA